MESYEEKYKEALKRAKENYHAGCLAPTLLEYIFPELKESEDERIRKWLEEHIEAMPDTSIEFRDVRQIDVLHWIERQGEKTSADKVKSKLNIGDWIVRRDGKRFSNGMITVQITSIDSEGRCWFDDNTKRICIEKILVEFIC